MSKRNQRFRFLFGLVSATLATWSVSVAAQPNPPEPPPAVPPDAPSATPAPSGLVPPKLTRFVEAPYPALAQRDGRTAEVVLQLDIDVDGQVTAVEVTTPAGHGFDEAAVTAAKQFVFAPAQRDGNPVPSRILYAYRFELKEAPPPPPEQQPPPKRTADLSGVVRLITGDTPMAGARVTLRGSDGKSLEVLTDANGRWSVTDLPPGAYEVRVEAAGFGPYGVQETLRAGEGIEVVYRLSPDDGPLEVTVRGERPDREITKRTIQRDELAKVPGTSGDALRAVQTMPGVARTNAFSGELIVRGTEPEGTGVFFDGTWIPTVYHFGGLSSVVPTEMIDSLDFYPGNFSVRYGREMGGIIDVRTRELGKDGRYHGLAQLDMIDARVLLEGPVPGLDAWSFVVAGRRSHLDVWLPSLLEAADINTRAAPVYYDYQAFVETHPTSTSRFRFGIFGSDDRFALTFNEGLQSDPGFASGFDIGTSFWRIQGAYENKISDDVAVSLTAAFGRDREDVNVGALKFDDTFTSLTVNGKVEVALAPTLKLRGGPDILYFPYEVDIRAPLPPRAGEPDAGPYGTQPSMVLKDTGSLTAPAAWTELEWKPDPRLQLLFGGRADYFNINDQWDFSPRFNGRYDIRPGFPRTTVKTGVGIFYQTPEPVYVVDVFGSPDVESNRSIHYSLGVEQELSEHAEVSVEGFYKDLDNLIVQVDNADGTQGYENLGTGKVIGLETLLRYKSDGRFFGWVAYTLSRSTRAEGPDEPERLFEYDQTHILTLLGSYKLGKGWTLGSRFRYVSGNLYTPCNGGVLNAAAGAYACRSGKPFSDRLAPFHQLDVRVDKEWKFTDWSFTTYLDLQNVYNRQNPEGVEYNYNYSQSNTIAGLPILPNLGVRGEF